MKSNRMRNIHSYSLVFLQVWQSGRGVIFGSGYGGTSLVNSLGFNDCLIMVSVNGMCSACDIETTLARCCASISGLCLFCGGSTCAGLLGCEGVTTFTFF